MSAVQSSRSSGPVRTCVGCRERAAQHDLLRVVAGDGVLIPDPSRRAPGRGAHLHPTTACLELALRRRAFPRALRAGNGLAAEAVEEYLREHGSSTSPTHDREEDGAAAHEHSMSSFR